MAQETEEADVKELYLNDKIISSTINYYGHGLLKQLADTSQHLLPPSAMKDISYNSFKERAPQLR